MGRLKMRFESAGRNPEAVSEVPFPHPYTPLPVGEGKGVRV